LSDSNARADAKAEAARAKALRPWYKKKRFVIPIVLIVLFVIIPLSVGGGDESGGERNGGDGSDLAVDTEGADTEGANTEESAGLNQPVRDGKFEFTVRSVQCGQTRVGNQFLNKEAQGQFCLVALQVKNVGDEPQTLFGDNMKLFDAEGREFSPDTEAAIYNEDSQTFIEEINPGNQIDGQLVFDVPTDAQPARLELHDSAFSGGVTVNLR
jgi:hypothetical protein